jgi:hypothetical protein
MIHIAHLRPTLVIRHHEDDMGPVRRRRKWHQQKSTQKENRFQWVHDRGVFPGLLFFRGFWLESIS